MNQPPPQQPIEADAIFYLNIPGTPTRFSKYYLYISAEF
jgi:hypothetical protein